MPNLHGVQRNSSHVTGQQQRGSVSVVTAEQDIFCMTKSPLGSGAHIVFHVFGTRGLFPRG